MDPIQEMAVMELEDHHDQIELNQDPPPNAQGSGCVAENQAGGQVFHPPTK